jgi:ABC-2 type transport system permease protein
VSLARSTTWRIASKELRERWREGRLSWAGGAVLLLLLTALAVGYDRQGEARAEQIHGQALDYSDWLSQDRRHPHNAAHQGMHAFKPEVSMAIVEPGINPYIGSTVWLQAHSQSEVKFRPAQDATGLQRFGDLSAGWILQVLGPLLVIVLGFDSWAGEREKGTYRQLASLGIPATRLMAAKTLTLLGSLAALLAPAGLLAVGAVVINADAGYRMDALVRFVVFSAGYAAYLSLFALLSLGVSALASTSRVAITVLLAVWVGQAVIAPRVLSEVARLRDPSPTRLQFDQRLSADLKATSDRTWTQAFGSTERWGPHVPLDKWGLALQLDDQASYAVYDRNYGALWDTWQRQQAFQEWSGIAFPPLAMRAFSMAMAGTDFAHHRDFTTAAERHRRKIQDIVSSDLVAHADTIGGVHFSYRAGTDFWAKVPAFDYRPPKIAWALKEATRSSVTLFIGLLLAVAFATFSANHRSRP